MNEFDEQVNYRSGWRPLARKDDPRVMSKTGVKTVKKTSEGEKNSAKEKPVSGDTLEVLAEIRTDLNSLIDMVAEQDKKIADLFSFLEGKEIAGKRGILGLPWRK